MNKYIIPIVLLLLSVGVSVGAGFYSKSFYFSDIDNQTDCGNKSKLSVSCQQDPKCCGAWDSVAKKCRHGQIDGNKCVSSGHVGPLLLLATGLVLFIAFVITLVRAIRKKV